MLRNETKPRRIFRRQDTALRRRILLIATLVTPYLLRAKPAAADDTPVLRLRKWNLVHSNARTTMRGGM